MLKKNNLKFGLLIGFIAPVLSLIGYYFYRYSLFSFGDFISLLRDNKSLVTAITIPCLFINIILFTIYINSRRDQTAKGIFAITLVYAIASLMFKFIG